MDIEFHPESWDKAGRALSESADMLYRSAHDAITIKKYKTRSRSELDLAAKENDAALYDP